ncbi:Heterodisulfide reductase [Gammaproteobacteria bacterium]
MSASLSRAINVLKEVIDAPIASYFNSCVHCGLCAEACLFHTETGDPKYAPIYKLEPLRRIYEQEYTLLGRLAKLLGLSKPITDKELSSWRELVYDSCTMCGRCSLICPMGNDLVYMIRRLREGMAIAGYAPPGVIEATRRAVEIGSPMGIKLSALKVQIAHVQAETGLEVPLDREGAEYMLILSSMEIINFPEFMAAIAKIMRQAGKTWTLCSEAFEATNSGIQIGVSDIAKIIVSRIVAGAEKLKVKTVISPECGHAFTALRWEGPNLIGRPYQFKVQHILEVLDEFREQGILKVSRLKEGRFTFHDPCQIVRMGGVIEPQRNLMKLLVQKFVEMPDSEKYNWCCGGGGGVSANEDTKALRLVAFKRKKTQLEAINADHLVTACANCRIILEEGIEYYRMDPLLQGLTELIADNLVMNPTTKAGVALSRASDD